MKTSDEIKKGLECCASVNAHCEICPFRTGTGAKCIRHMSEGAIAYIQQLEAAQPKWFSVKEKLPKNDDNYLVFTSDRNDVVIATYYGDGEWLDYDLTDLIPLVTHWMPLPSTEGIE